MITINHKTLGPITFDNGTSREEIANYLVEVDSIVGEQYGIGDTLGTQFGRSMGSSIRSIKGKLGLNTEVDDYEDQVAEYESRKMFEQNPVSSFGGMLAGGFADPITLPALALKPISFASKVGTYAARGGVQGGLGGLLEPTYDQYGDSTVLNIMAGVTLGSGLGAGVGKLVSKYGATPSQRLMLNKRVNHYRKVVKKYYKICLNLLMHLYVHDSKQLISLQKN